MVGEERESGVKASNIFCKVIKKKIDVCSFSVDCLDRLHSLVLRC